MIDSTMNGSYLPEKKKNDKFIKPECEISKNGLRLSPRGRYQVTFFSN